MKVKELIALLAEYGPDTEVYLDLGHSDPGRLSYEGGPYVPLVDKPALAKHPTDGRRKAVYIG